ncbi:hypothetical protein M2475_000237 [Breznakia sp. PF5-3]|uniref:hypothetical protein n=1 Tax=unclassified Breznakia TaxID=2623764 RepID=UPI002406FC67|nr:MULTISPECIES: hypothetical protein [unclassified Breznakia]MDF9823889.1 hypothetical protein [Breznakia sp. PM6-1]MDF9834688.1 hypothetical protein [Breznakia sp. PF5-3]MDF9836877.1 hypothetical protein [Breznakia sp. PFB2-8]MDF9858894.1 hypothetical protein [Breznakia sp. PH5-24]
MKKILIMCTVFFLSLSGCGSDNTDEEAQYQTYKQFKEKLIANNGTLSYNIPFNYEVEVIELDDGTYSYTVLVDNPQIVMNQIQMMALDAQAVTDDKMEPTIGVFEEETYSMVPNQVDAKKGYPEGLAINSISETKDFTIFVIVSFYKDDQTNMQVFFSFHVVDGVVVGDEVIYE